MNVFKKTVTLAAAVSLVCLSSTGAMAANKLIVKDSGAVDQFAVSDTGNIGVGLGTSVAPAAALHIIATGLFPYNAIKIEGNPTTVGAGFLCYNNNGTTPPANGDRLGFIYFGSTYDGTAHHPAGFAANTDATWTSTSTPAYFYFSTTAIDSTTRVERVRITSSGDVGINTTTPYATLDVNGSFRINPGNTLPASATVVSKPACSDSNRGTFWFTQASGNAKDSLELCASDGSGAGWRAIY